MTSSAPAVLDARTIYLHGCIGLPLAVIGYPLSIWIPAHYSGGLGLSLAAVGTILMLARFTDVITDPLMGELSDRWRTRFGRRKPWVFLGTPLMMTGVYLLFVPPEGIGFTYFPTLFDALFPRLDHDRATPSCLGGRTFPRLSPTQSGHSSTGAICFGGFNGCRSSANDHRGHG